MEQEVRVQQLSTCSTAPFATVPRAQLLLLAHRYRQWQNATIAQRVGGSGTTVKRWRQRWQTPDAVPDAPRAGTRRPCTARQRTQVVALACRAPRQDGKSWQRWASEQLAQGAVEQQSVATLAPGTMPRWLRADKIKPWR